MKKKPKVSVIVNCLNGKPFIDRCLKSIFSQSYNNFEIIFWDNNSSDNSFDIIKKFSSKKIRAFKSKKTTSLYEARNQAIKKSLGKYIAFLDVDDVWIKTKLKKQIELIEKNDSDVIYTNYYIMDQNIKKKFTEDKLEYKNMSFNILKNYSISISSALFKKKSAIKIGCFNKKYSIIGDFDFFYRMSIKGKFSVIQDPLIIYHIHNNNFSKKNLGLRIKEMRYWLLKNSSIKKNNLLKGVFKNKVDENLYFEFVYYLKIKSYKNCVTLINKMQIYTKIKSIIRFLKYFFFK